jgi:hypothetical protein
MQILIGAYPQSFNDIDDGRIYLVIELPSDMNIYRETYKKVSSMSGLNITRIESEYGLDYDWYDSEDVTFSSKDAELEAIDSIMDSYIPWDENTKSFMTINPDNSSNSYRYTRIRFDDKGFYFTACCKHTGAIIRSNYIEYQQVGMVMGDDK